MTEEQRALAIEHFKTCTTEIYWNTDLAEFVAIEGGNTSQTGYGSSPDEAVSDLVNDVGVYLVEEQKETTG